MRRAPISQTDLRETVHEHVAHMRGLAGPLLVAGSDDASSIGVLRFAESLARRERVNAHVLGVVRPVSTPVWVHAEVDPETIEAGRRLAHLEALRQRVHQSVGRSALFSVEVTTGHPARAIAAAAAARGSACILAGLAERDTPARRDSEHEVLEISRAAELPVIAVPAGHTVLPTRALVAVDFAESSHRAALVTRRLLGPDAHITLIHVAPVADPRVPGQERLAELYEECAATLLGDLRREIAGPDDGGVETVLAEGDPADEVLSLLTSGRFDLLACGTQGGLDREQFFTGRVSAALLRRAPCAVLLTPPGREGE